MTATFPLQVEAELEPGLSRWLWIVKWFLAIPHFIVLAFLWLAFGILTVVAFFAILFTGRYPRSIFEFNVGVIRWSWRVADYSFGVLGTDRYPPFSLAEDPTYPAHLEVDYPEHLSRWLVLVKWILALPHLIIVAILGGGGTWFAWSAGHSNAVGGFNLIGILVLVAGVVLAVTGTYPRGLFDLILGLNRWVLRVVAYTGLMTDQYPPFRLDMGGTEPGDTLTIPRPGGPGPETVPPNPAPPMPPQTASGWTAGRITAVVIGSLLALSSLGLLAGGGVVIWASATQRDPQGYINTAEHRFTTDTFALTAQADVGLGRQSGWVVTHGPGWFVSPGAGGSIRIRVTGSNGPVFVGIAPTADVNAYLQGVARSTVVDLMHPDYRTTAGSAPTRAPSTRSFWAASDVGSGPRSVTWSVSQGSWTIVVMNANASRGIDVQAAAGAKIPALPWIGAGLLSVGALFLIGGIALIAAPVRRASRSDKN